MSRTSGKRFVKRLPNAEDELFSAVNRYIKAFGGELLTVGPVELQGWPGDPKGMFKLAVGCLGKKPILKKGGL